MVKKFFPIVFLVVILDQITKLFANTILANGDIKLCSFFSFKLIKNTGAGFGILNQNPLVITILSFIITVALIFYVFKDKKDIVLFSLIIGGAIGNLINRIFIGSVTDFIYFSFWPAFNLADSAISIGVIILIYNEIRRNIKKSH